METLESHQAIDWDFDDNETVETASIGEPVSEVMEFFEMAASLIRTLAPDSTASKTNATSTPKTPS